ncbi:MAG: SDR family NAD(P)-dependent oxidoreductase [Propionibacteriaceae bacterium]
MTEFPNDRTAIVSGCAAPLGIGRAVARRLAADGWSLAVLDVRPEVEQFAAELAAERPGQKVVALQADVSDEEAVAAAFSRIDAELPPVVGEANVAGIACPTPLLELTAAEFDRVMAVNARGTMLMMREAAIRMRATGVGRIVNFASITAIDGGGTFSKIAYAAAKAAVVGLTKGGCRELGQYGITCNVLLPGPVDTEIMGGRLTDERKADMASGIPVGRVGQPTDIAALTAFLMSADAGYVSGASYLIDGGKHMV